MGSVNLNDYFFLLERVFSSFKNGIVFHAAVKPAEIFFFYMNMVNFAFFGPGENALKPVFLNYDKILSLCMCMCALYLPHCFAL